MEEITLRQSRAQQINGRIRANNALAAQCILEIAKDLRTMNIEKLYKEIGCDTFGDYCETLGMRERHGYNFISLLDRFGEEKLNSLQRLGITKLLEMSRLDDEDVSELVQSGAAEDLTVKELKEKIKEYERRQEQLTLDLSEASEKQKTESEALVTEIEALKKSLAEAMEKLRKAESEKNGNSALEAKIKVLEAKLKISPKPDKKELDELRVKLDGERIAAVNAARKQTAEQYQSEIERLEEENANLQSIAEKAKQPQITDDKKARVKICLEEIQRYFNLAIEAINSEEDELKTKHAAVLATVLERMNTILIESLPEVIPRNVQLDEDKE